MQHTEAAGDLCQCRMSAGSATRTFADLECIVGDISHHLGVIRLGHRGAGPITLEYLGPHLPETRPRISPNSGLTTE
jgi:hypothetical protein